MIFCLAQSVISISTLKEQYKLGNQGPKATELLGYCQKALILSIFN